MKIRKQYHFRVSPNGYFAWDVERLIRLCEPLPSQLIALVKIKELNEPYWYGDSSDIPSVRSIAEHAKLIEATDLNYPVILSSNGRVMDGMHRIAKAWMLGKETILAKQFENDPPPDHIDIQPNDLAYD